MRGLMKISPPLSNLPLRVKIFSFNRGCCRINSRRHSPTVPPVTLTLVIPPAWVCNEGGRLISTLMASRPIISLLISEEIKTGCDLACLDHAEVIEDKKDAHHQQHHQH